MDEIFLASFVNEIEKKAGVTGVGYVDDIAKLFAKALIGAGIGTAAVTGVTAGGYIAGRKAAGKPVSKRKAFARFLTRHPGKSILIPGSLPYTLGRLSRSKELMRKLD